MPSKSGDGEDVRDHWMSTGPTPSELIGEPQEVIERLGRNVDPVPWS